jgi:hypothetical protein
VRPGRLQSSTACCARPVQKSRTTSGRTCEIASTTPVRCPRYRKLEGILVGDPIPGCRVHPRFKECLNSLFHPGLVIHACADHGGEHDVLPIFIARTHIAAAVHQYCQGPQVTSGRRSVKRGLETVRENIRVRTVRKEDLNNPVSTPTWMPIGEATTGSRRATAQTRGRELRRSGT